MRRLFHLFFIPGLLGGSLSARAQRDSVHQVYHIALLAPLYLDSAFDEAGDYRFESNFPKFLNAGLEFYEGAQLAIDSLQKEGARLEVSLLDTKSLKRPLSQLLQSSELQGADLIIGHVSPSELRLFATMALQKNIPFINASVPNDGNITANHSLIILNSTLRTHCESIYRYLQRNYATQTIIVFSTKGLLEEKLKGYFTDIEKKTSSVPVKMKFVLLEKNFDTRNLRTYLDSNIQNVWVVASLDEAFARDFCFQLSPLAKNYRTTVIGMPTWDNIADFSKPLYNGLEIMYTTPFYINPNDSLVAHIQQYFKTNFYMRPSDMVFRGYETVYHFAKLLEEHGNNLIDHIGEKKFNVFDDFDIEPVFLRQPGTAPDYYENKKLYFIKKVDGNVSPVN